MILSKRQFFPTLSYIFLIFRLKSELRRHVAVAHYDGPFKCDQCPFEATKRWRLHEHVRFVHEKVMNNKKVL